MLRRILTVVLYAGLFAGATVVFTYFTFPLDRLREYIEHKVNSSPKYRLEIGSIERVGVDGLLLTDVNLGLSKKLFKKKASPTGLPDPAIQETDQNEDEEEKEGEEAGGGDEDGAFAYMLLDSLNLQFRPWDFLLADPVEVGVSSELLDGVIENGVLRFRRELGFSRPEIEFPVIEDVNLERTELSGVLFSFLIPMLRADRVKGNLDMGAVQLLPETEEGESYYQGQISMEFSDVVAMEPDLVLRMKNAVEAFPLTDMSLGSCELEVMLDRKDQFDDLRKVGDKTLDKRKYDSSTVLYFEKVRCARGASLDFELRKGSFVMIPEKASLSKGRLWVWLKFAFSPIYLEEKRFEDGVVVTRNLEVKDFIEVMPKWQNARDTDGFYWMKCTGKLARPKCRLKLPAEEKQRKRDVARREREVREAAKKLNTKAPKKTSDEVKTHPEIKKETVFDKRNKRADREDEEKNKETVHRKPESEPTSRKTPSGTRKTTRKTGAAITARDHAEASESEEGEEEYDEEYEGEEEYDEGEEGEEYGEEGEYEGEEGELLPEGEEGLAEEDVVEADWLPSEEEEGEEAPELEPFPEE